MHDIKKLNRGIRVGLIERMTFEQGSVQSRWRNKARKYQIKSVSFQGNNKCDETKAGMCLEYSTDNKETTMIVVIRLKGEELVVRSRNNTELNNLRFYELLLLVWLKWRAIRRFWVKQKLNLINIKRITLAAELIIIREQEWKQEDQLEKTIEVILGEEQWCSGKVIKCQQWETVGF